MKLRIKKRMMQCAHRVQVTTEAAVRNSVVKSIGKGDNDREETRVA